MNRQRIFNRVARHLLKQGEKARDDGRCLYRDERHGRRCAVGCLIPKKLYSPEIEGCPVRLLPAKIKKHIRVRSSSDVDFLQSLQMVHDCDLEQQWPKALKEFATKHHLEFKP